MDINNHAGYEPSMSRKCKAKVMIKFLTMTAPPSWPVTSMDNVIIGLEAYDDVFGSRINTSTRQEQWTSTTTQVTKYTIQMP